MKYSKSAEIEREVRARVAAGWRVEAGSKHRKLVAPNGRRIAIPTTPSDYRSHLAFAMRVRHIAAAC